MSAFEQVSRAGLFAREALGRAPAAERVAELRREPLVLVLAPELEDTRRGQVMLATAANLLGRLGDFVGAIDLEVGTRARVEHGVVGLRRGSRLAPAVAELLRSLRAPEADGAWEVRPHATRWPYARALVIGSRYPLSAREAVYVDGKRWMARVGPEPRAFTHEQQGLFNCFGPMVAAAWGVTEVAKALFRRLADGEAAGGFAPLDEIRTWDLWSHAFGAVQPGPQLRAGIDLGEVAVAGLGALGSAAVLALAQLGAIYGRIELVDDDRLSPTNLERVLTAYARDVGRRKIDLARRTLGGTGLRVVRVPHRYGAELPARARAPILVVGVDSGAARREIVGHLPYALYNGGTLGSEFLVSRHVAFEGACLACLYPQAEDPVGRTARQLGVDRATASNLLRGERTIDAEILGAMRERGGVEWRDVAERELVGRPLADLEGHVCSRAVVIEELPEATIGFVAALCGFLMACELVKDSLRLLRDAPLDTARPVFRLDLLASTPGAECVEEYVPRRDCFCQTPRVRRRIDALRDG